MTTTTSAAVCDPLYFEEGYRFQVVCHPCRIQTHITGYNIDAPFYSLDESGLLTAKVGYAWDGCSGLFTIQTKTNYHGGLAHDILYQAMRAGLLPHDPCFHLANEELRRICLEHGMSKLRAWYFYKAVESFGDAHAAKQPEHILIAL